MKLVIAEKPSVAQSLSAVIGATARKDGYLEGNGWRVPMYITRTTPSGVMTICLSCRNTGRWWWVKTKRNSLLC